MAYLGPRSCVLRGGTARGRGRARLPDAAHKNDLRLWPALNFLSVCFVLYMSGSPPHWLALRRMSLGVEGNEIYVFWFFLLLRSGLGYRVRGFLRTDSTGILGILVSRTLLLQKLLTESLGDIPLGSYPLGCSTIGFLILVSQL